MGRTSTPQLSRFLPQVALATSVVAVLPAGVVWALGSSGRITSMVALIALGVALSLALGWVGCLYWESRAGSGDLLFGELMIWGFLRRWRTERRLSSAVKLLGRSGTAGATEGPGLKRHARLLEELADALDARDPYTHRHSRRVARHAAMIAKRMGLPRDQVREVRAAAALHDVGKIETPREILQKPGRLSDEEFSVVKRHSLSGARMVRRVDERLALIVAHHHERLDGSGYPAGISGENIPIGSRIIAVADTFDAITSRRPYRAAQPHRQALEILSREAGTQLDPAVVSAFRSHYSGFRPLVIWALITSLPQRLFAPLGGRLGVAGGAGPVTKVIATATAIAAMAGAIATSPQILDQSPSSSPSVTAGLSPGDSSDPEAGREPGPDGGPGGGSGTPGGESPGSSGGGAGGDEGAESAGDTVNNVGSTVNETVKGVGSTVNETVKGVGNTANGALQGVGNTANGAPKGVGSSVNGALGGK